MCYIRSPPKAGFMSHSFLCVVLHDFIHSLQICLLTAYYVTVIILGVADRIMNKANQNCFL